jgi:hypothetical protein
MKRRLLTAVLLAGVGAILAGCEAARPVAPALVATTDLEIPINESIGAALLSSESTEILYAVRDKGGLKKKGKIGPFKGEANPTGSLNLSFQVAVGPEAVLSLQVNDADTREPLALGATYLSLFGGGGRVSPNGITANAVQYGGRKSVFMDLGSLVGSCSSFPYIYSGNYISFSTGQYYYYALGQDDVYLNSYYDANEWKGEFLEAFPAGADHIAYLGNGDMVDFAFVPADFGFHSDSRDAKQAAGADPYLAEGDVYCVKLNYISGHAWVQVGDIDDNDGIRTTLRYRANTSLPFYAWEQTPCFNW